jgi:hypothetical protein
MQIPTSQSSIDFHRIGMLLLMLALAPTTYGASTRLRLLGQLESRSAVRLSGIKKQPLTGSLILLFAVNLLLNCLGTGDKIHVQLRADLLSGLRSDFTNESG